MKHFVFFTLVALVLAVAPAFAQSGSITIKTSGKQTVTARAYTPDGSQFGTCIHHADKFSQCRYAEPKPDASGTASSGQTVINLTVTAGKAYFLVIFVENGEYQYGDDVPADAVVTSRF